MNLREWIYWQKVKYIHNKYHNNKYDHRNYDLDCQICYDKFIEELNKIPEVVKAMNLAAAKISNTMAELSSEILKSFIRSTAESTVNKETNGGNNG